MTLVRDPKTVGFVPRLVRIYRKQRTPVPVKVQNMEPGPRYMSMLSVDRRPRRWVCVQIAWHQARNARGM